MSETQPLETIDFEQMAKAGMHFGRKKTVFHPNMKPFIFGTKEQIHILDLAKTGDQLEKAAVFLKNALAEDKVILFVATTRQSVAPIEDIAKTLKMPYVSNRWLGGLLTNFKTIISRVHYLESLEQEKRDGAFEKYTKKEGVMKEREIDSLRKKFDGIRTLKKIPDILFISSLKEGQLPIREAKMTNVQTIAIVNTDSDPKQVKLAIPANDTSKKSVEFIINYLKNNTI